ncbi:hypothetical protein ABPG72_013337 [Tetrahymena utriculariae]
MGCLVLKKYFLQFLQGKFSFLEYEFACEHRQQKSQRNTFYFLFDLNSLSEGHQQKYSKSNFLAGIIYDQQEDVAEKLKNYIQNCLNENIQLKNKQYLEGFSNIIQGAYAFLDSFESFKASSQYLKYDGNKEMYQCVINLIMFIDNNIYLSKSISNQEGFQNKWCIKLQNILGIKLIENFSEVNHFKDVKNYDNYVYQLKEDANKVSEIILSSNQCPNDSITKNVLTQYPKTTLNSNNSRMYYLKLKF